MSLAIDAFSAVLYLAVVALIASPLRDRVPREAREKTRPREAVAFLCALISTLFIPWAGTPLVSQPVWAYPALVCAAVFMAGDDVRASSAFAVCVALAFVVTSRFGLSRGIPGELYGFEPICMFAVLAGSFEPVVLSAFAFILVGCVWSYQNIRTDEPCRGILSFSVAGALVSSVALFRLQPFFASQPQLRTACDFLFAMLIAALLQRVLTLAGSALRERGDAKGARIALPLLPALVGCCLLIAAL